MKLEQIIAAVVVIGLVVLYMGFRRGGDPSSYMDRKLGLAQGESVVTLWHGEYDRRFLGQGTAYWGGYAGLQVLLIAVTDRDRLVLGNQTRNDEPLSWSKGELSGVILVTPDEGELRGADGTLEPADVVDLQPVEGEALRIRLPRSAIDVLRRFASEGA